MRDVSIDLETLDKIPTAHILSIGAVRFNAVTGEIGEEFERRITMKVDQPGRTINVDTVRWWLTQSIEARSSLTVNADCTLGQALADFAHFIQPAEVVWGNGSTFDISILDHAYKYDSPWKYSHVNDMRTIVRAAELLTPWLRRDVPFIGEAHQALADAIHQARVISSAYKALQS